MILRDKDRERILQIARSIFSDRTEIWAYGSRVDGSAHEASDLDLVIRTSDLSPIPTAKLHAFRTALCESNIPIIVQVMDWGNIPESFHTNILKNYEVLFGGREGAGMLNGQK